ncbi:MAG: hypothetical protein KIS88_10660 [Anaerolineales bacterium]|nr:hypothetical protein [Anaerolineales bacterium]
MSSPNYRGARGSNAGDDYHELWVLTQALTLLDLSADLNLIEVEGISAATELNQNTWDGVDCTMYFGGDSIETASQIIIDQVKYSGANPANNWTLKRLSGPDPKGSILAKLARVFFAIQSKRPELVSQGKLALRLVSNQPLSQDVIAWLRSPDFDGLNWDSDVSLSLGFNETNLVEFTRCLDFSETGNDSRIKFRENLLRRINDWTGEASDGTVKTLLRSVRELMFPEAVGQAITTETVLSWMGVSSREALFPCPSHIKQTTNLISREISQEIVDALGNGIQYLCLHGTGGVGKTTAIQDIGRLLPESSKVVVYDCYGEGRYLDSDAYRHRNRDAFIQLINDLAVKSQLPLLINFKYDLNFVKLFKEKLTKASQILADQSSDALLLIVIDAADNSVMAAAQSASNEPSFVLDFVNIGDLPANIRFVITARSGRLENLKLPGKYNLIEARGFTLDETEQYVKSFWKTASPSWVQEFHVLAGGNPRVEYYALSQSKENFEDAIEHLRPNGKNLDQIFTSQLELARRKGASKSEMALLCGALARLPRPIPISYIEKVTSLSGSLITDLSSDLAPGIILYENLLGFSDEDFETFIREEGRSVTASVDQDISQVLFLERHEDSYAAAHIASALFNAGRRGDILSLAEEGEPKVIQDLVLRREVYLKRLRLSMKVCREAGNNPDAILILLKGAEALKTSDVIQAVLYDHPTLTSAYASPSVIKLLSDPNTYERHGPLLFHLMRANAEKNDRIKAKGNFRAISAWMKSRANFIEQEKERHPQVNPQGWDIGIDEIAAEAEAVLMLDGPGEAIEFLRRWRPKRVQLHAAMKLSQKLIKQGKHSLIQKCIDEPGIPNAWKFFFLVDRAASGQNFDLSLLRDGLGSLLRRGLFRPQQLKGAKYVDDFTPEYFDKLILGIEILVANGILSDDVLAALQVLSDPRARQAASLFSSDTNFLDVVMRAYVLNRRIKKRKPTPSSFLLKIRSRGKGESLETRAKEEKHFREIEEFLAPFFEFYELRAETILGLLDKDNIVSKFIDVTARINSNYRVSNSHWSQAMKAKVSTSCISILLLMGIDERNLWELSLALLNLPLDSLSTRDADLLDILAYKQEMHDLIIGYLSNRSNVILGQRVSASEKTEWLIRNAKTLQPISLNDSQAIFNKAIDVADQIDSNALHEIKLFAPLVDSARTLIDADKKREFSSRLIEIYGDLAIRLQGEDGFPWEKISSSLVGLDTTLALAACATWEDQGIVGREKLLPGIISAGLYYGDLTAAQAVSFLELLDFLDIEVLSQILTVLSSEEDASSKEKIVEVLAKKELLHFGLRPRKQVFEKLAATASSSQHLFWLAKLEETLLFLSLGEESNDSETTEDASTFSIDLEVAQLTNPAYILDIVQQAKSTASVQNRYISEVFIYKWIASKVAPKDRLNHIEALVELADRVNFPQELLGILIEKLKDWKNSPSVISWCEQQLPQVIDRYLPEFARYIGWGESNLLEAIELTKSSGDQKVESILRAVEKHLDVLTIPNLIGILELACKYSPSGDNRKILESFSLRLLGRIPEDQRSQFDWTKAPQTSKQGICRFLYALMGDIDVRVRWMAIHAFECLVLLSQDPESVISSFLENYQLKEDPVFRAPDKPFYWIAARLWLSIGMAKIANEKPSSLTRFTETIFKIYMDPDFPHILIRQMAKSILLRLHDVEAVLTPEQLEATQNPLSQLPRKAKAKNGFGLRQSRSESMEGFRFHFDSMDTLPYWYEPVVNLFADLPFREFLLMAERWIVETWGVTEDPWKWDDEPRAHMFSDRRYSLWDHRHGSMPVLERYKNYLEWHAMMCSVGEALQSYPLAKTTQYSFSSLEEWMREKSLAHPPQWLSDFHLAKPLESNIWNPPAENILSWIGTNSLNDFQIEFEQGDFFIVGGHKQSNQAKFSFEVNISSALVSPKTARSLLNALEAVKDPWDYALPETDGQHEINEPGFLLKGWLRQNNNSGADDYDPFSYHIRRIEIEPSKRVLSDLDLSYVFDQYPSWTNSEGEKIFHYYAWSDNRKDFSDSHKYYGEDVYSSGWRLCINKKNLLRYLTLRKLDMIFSVKLEKRNYSYESERYSSEKKEENRIHHLFLLRRTGHLEVPDKDD